MPFTRTNWMNYSPPAINAANLLNMEDGIWYGLAHSGGIRNTAEFLDRNPASTTGGLAEAIADLGGSPGVIFAAPHNHPINVNTAIPATVHLMAGRGATFTIANGVTLTINGTIEAGLYQIFNWAGTGAVVFANNGQLKEVYPQWWGAVGDGVTVNTSAFQACLNAIGAGSGQTPVQKMKIPAGEYILGALSRDANNIFIEGDGLLTTILDFGTTAGDCLTLGTTPARQSIALRNLKFRGDTGTGGQVLAKILNVTFVSGENLMFESAGRTSLQIEGCNQIKLNHCFSFEHQNAGLYLLRTASSNINKCTVEDFTFATSVGTGMGMRLGAAEATKNGSVLNVLNCVFELNDGNGMYLYAPWDNINIKNSYFENLGAARSDVRLSDRAVNGLIFEGNYSVSNNAYMLFLANCNGASIKGNKDNDRTAPKAMFLFNGNNENIEVGPNHLVTGRKYWFQGANDRVEVKDGVDATTATMAGNETFENDAGHVFVRDPGGAGRNFNPSGTFCAGHEITLVNTADAAETITFDSAGLNQAVAQNQRGIFVYDGTNWRKVFVG